MSRYELGMSIDYCSNWSIADAVREFFQNAKDEETVNPDNKMYFNYENNVLTIGNKLSELSTKTLLLGVSSKRNDARTVGNFGEGYKVATVVLMRHGITVKIYNNEAKEIWTSKIVKSRRYQSDIVVYDIEKKFFKKDYDLIFELDGITEDMYNEVRERILDLQDDIGKTESCQYGRILIEPRYSGNIYVSGLFVCHKDHIKWGYDFNPEVVTLDRDRGLVDTWDLKFSIAKLISSAVDVDFIVDNIKEPDLEYVELYLKNDKTKHQEAGKIIYDNFVETYGDDFYPVSTNDEFNVATDKGYKAVMVLDSEKNLIKPYVKEKQQGIDIESRYALWRDDARSFLPSTLLEEIDKLWEEKGKC